MSQIHCFYLLCLATVIIGFVQQQYIVREGDIVDICARYQAGQFKTPDNASFYIESAILGPSELVVSLFGVCDNSE